MTQHASFDMPRPARFPRTAVACLVALAFVHIAAHAQPPRTRGHIAWRSGTLTTRAQDAATITAALENTTRSNRRHVVVQLHQPATAAQRLALASAGLVLQHYLGDNAFFARLDSHRANTRALAEQSLVRCVLPIQPEWKTHPDFLTSNVPVWAILEGPALKDRVLLGGKNSQETTDLLVAAYVVFHPDVPLATTAVQTCRHHGARVRSQLESVHALVIELPLNRINALAAEDGVMWIEPPLPALEPTNNDNRQRTGADIAQDPPYNLDGSGVSVLVYDAGTGDPNHPDFGGRLNVRDTSGTAYHPTHVAGTIGGSGFESQGFYRGMAPGVTIEAYGYEQPGGLQPGFLYTDPGDMEDDYSEAISTYGADIANNSIGTNTARNGFPCDWEGNYGVTAAMIDTIVRGDGNNPLFTQPFRIVWSNGNERGNGRCGTDYFTTAPPACAKNMIAVGALNSDDDSMTDFSSWGPCDDGRLKPDLSGPGCQISEDEGVTSCMSGFGGYVTLCGTSMSSPTVCGLGALLIQDYRRQYPGQPDFRNATLKALLAQTAADIEEPGPDYKSGYGSVRVVPAIELLRSGNFLQDTVDQGETFSAVVIVQSGESEVKITLAWDDVPGTPDVVPSLVNDLDLRVLDPNGVQYYPWTLDPNNPAQPAVRTQADHVNNIEQVYIDNAIPGAYEVEIVGFNVPSGPQPFSLTATPYLVHCSSAGTARLDRSSYRCEDVAILNVIDCDLNTSNSVIDTVDVLVDSDTEPTGEIVTLVETAPQSAAFAGTVTLSELDAPGVLQVSPGDTVTLTYDDADTGAGQPGTATDTATIDCTFPSIANVQTGDIMPGSVTITCDTDEPARVTVRYGLDCGNFDQEKSGTLRTAHTIHLTDLLDESTYAFVVEATDEAGNVTIDDNGGACYTFQTPRQPIYFTEIFFADNDLENISVTFSPDGSPDFYAGCAEPITVLPTDPNGGTPLSLDDDAHTQVALTGGAQVPLYGIAYDAFYVGSNGFITFTGGDNDPLESLADHFEQPRVSGLFDDLDPSVAGTVSFRQLADRVTVTYEDVPEYDQTNANTFQIELYFDGTIVLSYLNIDSADGIAGLSEGLGLPTFYADTDLSALDDCGPRPPGTPDIHITTAVSIPAAIELLAVDDGLPDPPGALTYTVTSLPTVGQISDPAAGPITTVPYELLNNARTVDYTPDPGYHGDDTFQFKAHDGGTPPDGGDSNIATVTVQMGGPDWDPVAHSFTWTTTLSQPGDIPLRAHDPNLDPLTFVIDSLPDQGQLYDPNGLSIASVPFTLPGNTVHYHPPSGIATETSFNFSVQDATSSSNSATTTIRVGGEQLLYAFPLDSDPAWNTGGEWAFGRPTGQGGTYGDPDPTAGVSGLYVYGYNLDGDYPNDLPRRNLKSMPLDCSNATNVRLHFWRWLGVESANSDRAKVSVSNNDNDWDLAWENPPTFITDGQWLQQSLDISATADNQPTVYLRWTMGPTDNVVTYCGWNIDDIEVWGDLPVPTTGACCAPDNTCTLTLEADCTDVWLGAGTTCTPNLCAQRGSCCLPTGDCQIVIEPDCTGTWHGIGTACEPNPCPQPGACCTADGACEEIAEPFCTGQWLGLGTGCDPTPCPQPGACCAPDGSCNEVAQPWCNDHFLGVGTTCDPSPCVAACLGDCNCDGEVAFDDIEYFIAAIPGYNSWVGYHQSQTGSVPGCPYSNCNADGQGGVDFNDIWPFIQLIGLPCQ
jgi:hypothetical protein